MDKEILAKYIFLKSSGELIKEGGISDILMEIPSAGLSLLEAAGGLSATAGGLWYLANRHRMLEDKLQKMKMKKLDEKLKELREDING